MKDSLTGFLLSIFLIGLPFSMGFLLGKSKSNDFEKGKEIGLKEGFKSGYAAAQLDILEIDPNAPTP